MQNYPHKEKIHLTSADSASDGNSSNDKTRLFWYTGEKTQEIVNSEFSINLQEKFEFIVFAFFFHLLEHVNAEAVVHCVGGENDDGGEDWTRDNAQGVSFFCCFFC